jgi:two-component system, LytTR family, sensor kinase
MNETVIKDTKKRNQLYWLLHLTGWAAYLLFKVFAGSFLGENLYKLLGNYALMFIVIVTITHFYKRKILSKWVNLPVSKLVVRLLAGALTMIAGIFIFNIILSLIIVLIFSITGKEVTNIGVNSLQYRWQTGLFILSVFMDLIAVFLWSVLYVGFRYFENLQQSRIQQAEEEGRVKDMQLKQLIRQLNPHFLFNAINSIKALTIVDAEKARDALSEMSDILRHTLNSEKSVQIPLEKELNIVEDYLSLEKIRFGKRLRYAVSCTPEAAHWPVPPVIVQTLAENAVRHGISTLEEGGEVKVNASTDEAFLLIEIINTGSIDTQKLFSGIGTNNTVHRLKLLYGDKASFSARNEGGNVIVNIKIPKAL